MRDTFFLPEKLARVLTAVLSQQPQPSRSLARLRSLKAICLCLCLLFGAGRAAHAQLTLLPAEVQSRDFSIQIGQRRQAALHATGNYSVANIEIDKPTQVVVIAKDPHFWDRGVEIQPVRYGIRPERRAGALRFLMPAAAKLSITRPGDHFSDSKMLFLFANPRSAPPRTPGIRVFGPGVHRENIDARSGDRIYLAPGAVVFGALNLWQVHDVRVLGTGTIIYDGPQDPHTDEGWMHKRNWHCIVMDEATNIEVDGITCITRSRTWQVQMKDSRHIGFYNVKIIGGNPNNANQDGLDWLGGGDTRVDDSFFRASDDVFALQGNWEGYDIALLSRPGRDVSNISITNTVASTSISNIVRVGWPQKTFNSSNFSMADVDVIHAGMGACNVPFAFFELWADPNGHGSHRDYSFRNIRLEDWYSLFQIRQQNPQIRGVQFRDVWAMKGPAMLPPLLSGDVQQVSLRDAVVNGVQGGQVIVVNGASPPALQTGEQLSAQFRYSTGALQPGQSIEFAATAPPVPGRSFDWSFGDGTHAEGPRVVHRFPDREGTLLDGSGSFRVILHVRDASAENWQQQSVVLGEHVLPADARGMPAVARDTGATSTAFDGHFDVPGDGGYTLTWLTSTQGSFTIDDEPAVLTPHPQHQVCGAPGDAVQPVAQSALMAAGTHRVHIERSNTLENAQLPAGGASDLPVVLIEGPGMPRQQLVLRP